MNYFTLYDGTDAASANKTSLSFGVGLSGSGVWDAPARKGESISIPGRNGNIWVDDGSWENIFVTYPCWIADGFDQKVDEFRGWLAQHSDKYYRITDTYHPDEYRLGRFAGEFLATPGTRNLTGRFDVVFECVPFRYILSGEEEFSQTVTQSSGGDFYLQNPTQYYAYPLFSFSSASVTDHSQTLYVMMQSTGQGVQTAAASIDIAAILEQLDGGTSFYLDSKNIIFFRNEDLTGPIYVPDNTVVFDDIGFEITRQDFGLGPGHNTITLSFEKETVPAQVTIKTYPTWYTI